MNAIRSALIAALPAITAEEAANNECLAGIVAAHRRDVFQALTTNTYATARQRRTVCEAPTVVVKNDASGVLVTVGTTSFCSMEFL